MPLLEAVTIEVGAAIAKSILKLWVKDSKLADDISSSLIDLLKSGTSDTLAQRRGQRQFDAIGEKVGESLLPLFEIEGAHLDEGSRIAVAHEVAAAFNKSKLSSELLAKRNLDPAELARYVLAGHSIAAQPYSDAERAFYQRIIEVSCAYIVDIASQLPAFTERTFAEVLKREDQLLARTDEILQEIRHVREQLNPKVAPERFEIDYRLSVARKLDELQLVGADVSLPNRRHRLSVAYITLSASVDQRKPLLEKNETPTHIVALENPEKHQASLGSNIVAVDTALARSHRLLIRGLAGSGKTTLLQWIAVKSATGTFEGQLSDWNGSLPFYIRLRQCVQPGLPKPEAFPGLVVTTMADAVPEGWVRSALDSGRAIVLVDGLDEISASRREEVRLWLKELVGMYPRARFIVTSRPHAIEEGWMDHEGFGDAELQPMQQSDISMFIDHWHKAVREELHSDEERGALEPLAEHLKNEMRRNRAIRNLATNPLLCSMLCALNRERGRQMPKDRIELYEACCSLLIERRDQVRNVDLTDYPALQLHYRQKRRFLEDLAYWMIKNGWSEVPRHLVEERFTKKLTEMQDIPRNVSGAAIRHLFVERTGIIREPVHGQIDFVHRTFQEFLAAQAAADEMDIGVLVANAHNDQWREVIILACGLASIPMREMLIQDLITTGDRKKKYRHRLHILAVSCLDTSVDLGQKLKTEVEKRLSHLVPPKNKADATSLAAAGELAVKYLSRDESYAAPTAAACVRSLALIGGETALDKLEGYATDTRQEIVDELLQAWDSFDRGSYAKHVLSKTFRDQSSLSLSRLPSLDGFQYFTHLTTLNLSDTQVSDLGPLAGLSSLTELSLSHAQVSDLGPLAGLSSLTSLDLMNTQISDLGSLAGLSSLTVLYLSGTQVSDLGPLAGLSSLTSLDLSGTQVSDLRPLAGLSSLTSLDLGFTQISDLGPLADLSSLTTLYLSFTQISDLGPLAGLSSLTTLFLIGTQISDVGLLAGLSSLTTLSLSNTQISDLGPLAGLSSLTWLDLSNTQISDVGPLAGLSSLTTLYLSGTQVSNLHVLNGLTNLDIVGVSTLQRINRGIKGSMKAIFGE